MKRIIDFLRHQVASTLQQGFSIDDASWGDQSGVLITGRDANAIINALKQSSSIPWPEEAAWSKAPRGVYARAVDKDGNCYFYLMAFDIDRHGGETQYCGEIVDMTSINWKETLEFNPSLKSEP